MENKKFTKDDLKVGYVMKQRNNVLVMVMAFGGGSLAFVEENGRWLSDDSYKTDLTYIPKLATVLNELDIVEVYGLCKYPDRTLKVSTGCRDLLGKREDPAKKMTVEEIEKELGYKIEIVS